MEYLRQIHKTIPDELPVEEWQSVEADTLQGAIAADFPRDFEIDGRFYVYVAHDESGNRHPETGAPILVHRFVIRAEATNTIPLPLPSALANADMVGWRMRSTG